MPSAFLLNPPSLPGTTANREGSAGMGALVEQEGGFFYPPQLLAGAAASLRQAGWRVAGLDAVALRLGTQEAIERLPRADMLVLPASYATLAADRAFLNRLREEKPLLKVLLLGPALSHPQVDHALSDLADLLLAGEPELALPAAAKHLLAGDLRVGQVVNPYTLAQEAYQPNGLIADLDALPWPAWDVFLRSSARYPFLTLSSTRGCPAGCRFCPYAVAQGHEHRCQSPRRTADELSYLAGRFHPGHVIFRDPVFAHDRNRVLALCTELRRRNLGLTWECESRPEHFDTRLLRAMRAAGCTVVKLGLESSDPELLAAVGRVAREEDAAAYVQQVATVVAACAEQDLLCRVFVMAGLPNQTIDSARRTAASLRSMGPHRLHVKTFQWYPGIDLPHVAESQVDAQVALLVASTRQAGPLWQRAAGRLRREVAAARARGLGGPARGEVRRAGSEGQTPQPPKHRE